MTQILALMGDFCFNKDLKADGKLICEIEKYYSVSLPNDYIEFIKMYNGGEGYIGTNSYLILWTIDNYTSLIDSKKYYDYYGLLFFASDAADMGYAFDYRNTPLRIVEIPFIDIGLSEPEFLGNSFYDFIKSFHLLI